MKRSRFSDEQIIAILKEQEAGMPTSEVCRRHGISPATFYKWKAKYGGLPPLWHDAPHHASCRCLRPSGFDRWRMRMRS